jgi:hypothetical protein
MAQWVRRARAGGGESIQIKWRMDGRWQGETFTDARAAAEFRTAVENAGHRWPPGWVRGSGWVRPEPEAGPDPGVHTRPDAGLTPVPVTVEEVATGPGRVLRWADQTDAARQDQAVHPAS